MTTRDPDINIFHLAPSFQRKKVLLEIESPAGPSSGAAVTAKDNPPLTLTFLSPPLQKAESGRRGDAKRAAVDPTTSGDGSLRQAPFVPLAHKRTREKSQSYLFFFCLFVCFSSLCFHVADVNYVPLSSRLLEEAPSTGGIFVFALITPSFARRAASLQRTQLYGERGGGVVGGGSVGDEESGSGGFLPT